jgi:hypothetical protein
LEDGTIAKTRGIFQVTLFKAAVSAWRSEMQGIEPCCEFLEQKEQAFLCLLELLGRGGLPDMRQ